MRKVFAVVRREFVERVRKRSFWIMAILGPVFFGAVFLLPVLLSGAGGHKTIVVVDRTSSGFGSAVIGRLDSTGRFTARRLVGTAGLEDSLREAVGRKALDGYLVLTDSVLETGAAEYSASNISSLEDIGMLRETLGRLVENARLTRSGVDPRLVAQAQLQVRLRTQKITHGQATGESAGQSFSLAYFMSLTLYIALILYGVQVMGSVIEEKTSKIVEVLASSLKPFQLLMGKLLGVGAASLVQFGIWGVSGRLMLSQRATLLGKMGGPGPGDAGQVFQVPHVPGSTLVVFILFFLGGYFLYSAMFAAVAAMSGTEQEARQSQAPVTMLIMIAFFSSFAILANPESKLAVTLTLIPFTAPIATPVRWAAGSLGWADVVASLALLVVGIIGVTWVAARIYRVGILMTGKRPSLREVARWVRTA